ncbi:MAG TPA: TetR-like C-terminal domain-containing protein [Acidimicrobiales bacterium]
MSEAVYVGDDGGGGIDYGAVEEGRFVCPDLVGVVVPERVVRQEAGSALGVVNNCDFEQPPIRPEHLDDLFDESDVIDYFGSDSTAGDPAAALRRLNAIGVAYLEFARQEPGLFATAFSVPQQHSYGVPDDDTGAHPTPLTQLRTVLDELVEAHILDRRRREGIEYPIWSVVHGLAVLTGQGPLRDLPDTSRRHLEQLASTFIGFALA